MRPAAWWPVAGPGQSGRAYRVTGAGGGHAENLQGLADTDGVAEPELQWERLAQVPVRLHAVAIWVANRVLPVPPTPVSVTRRAVDSSRFTSTIAARRSTKLVNSAASWPFCARVRPAMCPPASTTSPG